MAARGAKRKRDQFGQTVARREIASHLASQGGSLRRLAARAGFKGHGSLSRFLAGKQHLPFATVLELCRELGIEGLALQRVIDAFALAGLPVVAQAAARRAITADAASEGRRLRDARFFLNERVPFVYETVRLLRRATAADIMRALHPRWRFRLEHIAVCLDGLAGLGLVERDGDFWRPLDASRDVVIPSKYSTEVGKRSVRFALAMQQAFLDEGVESRLVRTILTSLNVPPGRSWRDALADRFVTWQDEVLALQGESDNTVLNIVIGVTEVARR